MQFMEFNDLIKNHCCEWKRTKVILRKNTVVKCRSMIDWRKLCLDFNDDILKKFQNLTFPDHFPLLRKWKHYEEQEDICIIQYPLKELIDTIKGFHHSLFCDPFVPILNLTISAILVYFKALESRAFYLGKYEFDDDVMNVEHSEQYLDLKSTGNNGFITPAMMEKKLKKRIESKKKQEKKQEEEEERIGPTTTTQQVKKPVFGASNRYYFEMDTLLTEMYEWFYVNYEFEKITTIFSSQEILNDFNLEFVITQILTIVRDSDADLFNQILKTFLDDLFFMESDLRLYIRNFSYNHTITSKRVILSTKFSEYVEFIPNTKHEILSRIEDPELNNPEEPIEKIKNSFIIDGCFLVLSFLDRERNDSTDILKEIFLVDYRERVNNRINIFKLRGLNKNWIAWISEECCWETSSFVEAFYVLRHFLRSNPELDVDPRLKYFDSLFFPHILK